MLKRLFQRCLSEHGFTVRVGADASSLIARSGSAQPGGLQASIH